MSRLSTNTDNEEDIDDSATEETKMADEKKKFLEDLEESNVEKEKSEKEETDEEEEEESSSSEEESDDEFDPNDSDDDVKKKGFMAKKAPPKRKAPAGRGRGGAFKMPTALTGELSEYEKIRQGNIAEREAMLQDLMADFDRFKKDSGIGAAKKAPSKKKKYDSSDEGEIRGNKVRVRDLRKSVRIPEEEMVEGLAKSVRAPLPGKRLNKSRATSSGPTVNPPRCRLI